MAGTFFCFLIGFEEDAFSRGVYLQVMIRRYGVMGGAAFTAALFGLGHLHNLPSGASVLGVLVQVVLAAAIGWVFVAVRLRTNSSWPAIIVHMLIDFSGFIGGSIQVQAESPDSAVVSIVVALVVVVDGYLSMRGIIRTADRKTIPPTTKASFD